MMSETENMEEQVVENETNNGEIKENDEEKGPSSPVPTEVEIEPCRLCDEIGEKMFNIFEDNPEGYQLIGLIKENLPIVLYKTDPLSKHICEKCILNLQIISSLKKRSRKTQEIYVEKLKKEGDTTDKNVLLFLGCTGSKLVDNGEEDDEEEEELKDEATSTEDLTILCANCKTAILDASSVNGEVELSTDLHKAIAESLKRNRVVTGESESEKVLRKRKVQPIYQELDDSLCSSLTDLTHRGEEDSQYGEEPASEGESEDSNEERPSKRRKIVKDSEEIQAEIDREMARAQAANNTEDENDSEKAESENVEGGEEEEEEEERKEDEKENSDDNEENEESEMDIDEGNVGDKGEEESMEVEKEVEKAVEEQEKEPEKEEEKIDYGTWFQNEPEFTVEPLSLLQIALNAINKQNVPDYEPSEPYTVKESACKCQTCGEEFKNVKLLALHEPEHIEVFVEEKIDNPKPWPNSHPFAKVRNRWLTFFDENGYDDEDIVVNDLLNGSKEDSNLLVENTEKTIEVHKKDEVVLVNMKPMVNGMYLGDYTKEERKAFYQCMRIGGQTKRFCPLCRYCFKDNWAIESHYFSLACHYTCRYCGMRFNKQRHRFDEHTKEHKKKADPVSDKIFTASKVNNTLPKVIQPDKVKRIIPGEPEKPREIRLEDYAFPPVITKGGSDPRNRYPVTPQQQINFHGIKIKEEPKDKDFVSSQSKTQNQAYFCRKCYKVFFKLDEFNAHSKNCDYNNYPQSFRAVNASPGSNPKTPTIQIKKEPGTPASVERRFNGDISSAGRPVRNCVRDIGPYKDEVYIPKQLLNETVPGPPQSFICHICGTPFPTIYSRNSHMRIHKGETPGSTSNGTANPQLQQNILKQRLQQQQHNILMQRAAMQQQQIHLKQKQMIQQQKQHQQQLQQRQMQQQTNYSQFEEIRVKEEPVDSFEPMVEIHEGHEQPPSPPQPSFRPSAAAAPSVPRELGGGAVSLTPIVKKPVLNPNILKLVENNPNISISKRASDKPSTNGAEPPRILPNIKNAGGYQGPYAPTNQSPSSSNGSLSQGGSFNGSSSSSYITVSPNLMPGGDDNKSYKCSSCWEAFSNKSHLYFHKKNQCEGSRFPCPFCKKRFGTEAAYSSHIFYSHPE